MHLLGTIMNSSLCSFHRSTRLQLCSRPFGTRYPRLATCTVQAAQRSPLVTHQQDERQQEVPSSSTQESPGQLAVSLSASMTLWLLSELPSLAAGELAGSPPASSYYVSLGLFLITLPGEGQLQTTPAVSVMLGVRLHGVMQNCLPPAKHACGLFGFWVGYYLLLGSEGY